MAHGALDLLEKYGTLGPLSPRVLAHRALNLLENLAHRALGLRRLFDLVLVD